MKKSLCFLVSLLAFCLGSYAADPPAWANVSAFDGSQYSKECVVYADLQNANGIAPQSLENYIVGAFIDGQLRGVVRGTSQSVSGGGSSVNYFPLRIKGETADNGKAIEFRLVVYEPSPAALIYSNWYRVAGATSLTFQADATVGGTPSNLYHLQFTEPTSVGLSQATFDINVGQTVNLKSYIKVTPANATKPEDVTFSEGNFLPYFIVEEGHILRGVAPNVNETYPMTLALFLPNAIDYYAARVIVRQPITSMTLKTAYQSGITVNVGDAASLTYALNNCYIVAPANATEVPVWSSTNTSAISTDASGAWVPRQLGTYNMTLTASNTSLTVPVRIVQPVTALTATLTDIYVGVGDEITTLLKVDTKVQPANATNPAVTYTVGSTAGTTSILQQHSDGTITAVAAGTQEVVASHPDVPNAPVVYTIHVHTKVNSFVVNQPSISVLWDPNIAGNYGMNITKAVRENFSMLPQTNYSSRFYTMSASDQTVLNVIPQDTGYQVNALRIGSSRITLTRTFQETQIANGQLANRTRTITANFMVNIVAGLTSLVADPIEMGNTGTYQLRLTPVPAGAVFDPNLISLELFVRDPVPDWTMMEFQKADATGLLWTLKPRSVLKDGVLNVKYSGQRFSSIFVNVGQTITAHAGWQWKSNFAGAMTNLSDDYHWDELQEIRTQEDLLYNDDQYGYFGTLQTLPRGGCFKMRLKDGAGNISFVVPTDGYFPSSRTSMTLTPRWSWMGNPYQYNHTINDVFGQSVVGFTEGDRIVSRDGFAEYDGSQWTGTLTTLPAGEGFMFYNAASQSRQHILPAERTFSQPASSGPNGAPVKELRSDLWSYNSARFANNMTIVADVPGLAFQEDCSIGAFVGDECRGQGTAVDGRFFITVHGEAGEAVSFKVYDRSTSECRMLNTRLSFTDKAGTIARPVTMPLGEATGIDAAATGRSAICVIDGRLSIEGLSVKTFRVYTAGGTLVLQDNPDLGQLPTGVYLVTVVTTDGRTLTTKVAR